MPFKWEKLTVKSQQAVQAAASLAAENGNPEVLPMHLLAALLEDREGVVLPVLEGAGVRVQQLLAGANAAIAKLPKVSGANAQPAMAASMQKVLDRASKEADSFKDDFISTEHLLLALTEAPKIGGQSEPTRDALAAMGATHDSVLKALSAVRGSQRVTDQNPEAKFQALEKYGKDLTDLARKGSSTPSSAAMRRFAASSRSSRAAPKTTPSSSASPVSARPPSSKVSPAASFRATSPRYSKTSASSHSTSPA